MIYIELQIQRTRLPFFYRRRVALRNSKIRQDVSNHCNYERIWFAKVEVCFEWGQYDPTRPQWHRDRLGKWASKPVKINA